jgi:hypothetical protein
MLIGLSGCKGVGKDTVGRILVQEHGFTRIAFADKLKQAVANLFDISIEQVDEWKNHPGADYNVEVMIHYPPDHEYAFTWRLFLQRFGTEMGRNTFGRHFWVDQWKRAYDEAEGDIVVTDVRFVNEVMEITIYEADIVEITRPGHEPDGHESEEPLPSKLIDYTIDNSGSLDDLRTAVGVMLDEL